MTVEELMNVSTGYMTIVEDGDSVAWYDGRNSIPTEYNAREVRTIEAVGSNLFVHIK